MTPDEILLETEAAMEKGVEYMIHEFARCERERRRLPSWKIWMSMHMGPR